MAPIIVEMIGVVYKSIDDLKSRLTDIHWGPIENNIDVIYFNLDGQKKAGYLRGRNRNLMIGLNEEADKAIVVRIILDGDMKDV
jgi:hypothetical protein